MLESLITESTGSILTHRFDEENKEKRVKQHIWGHTEQKLTTTNHRLFQPLIVTNAFGKNSTAKMLGPSDFHEMEGVVRRKWTSRSHQPLTSAEGIIPTWKMSKQNYAHPDCNGTCLGWKHIFHGLCVTSEAMVFVPSPAEQTFL